MAHHQEAGHGRKPIPYADRQPSLNRNPLLPLKTSEFTARTPFMPMNALGTAPLTLGLTS